MAKLIYTESELPQKSQIWKDERDKFIGGSDMSILTGDLPQIFDTQYDLFLRKTGQAPPKEMNASMQHGVNYEDEARRYIENYLKETYGIDAHFEPLVAIEPNGQDIMVSFDGIDIENKLFVEIKCQSEKNFVKTVKTGMPSYYRAQVQSQACVANAHWGITKGFFCSYFPTPVDVTTRTTVDRKYIFNTFTTQLACIPIEYDVEYCCYLKKLAKAFRDMIKAGEYDEFWDLI